MLRRMSTPAPQSRVGPALVALGLAVAGATISILLLRDHLTALEGDIAGSLFCGGAGRFDCNTVAASPSAWLAGLPLPLWGIAFYAVAGALALLAWRMPDGEAAAAAAAGTVLAFTAVIFDLWLGIVMVTQIGAICLNCVSTYAINVGIAIAFWRIDRRITVGREWGSLIARWLAQGPGRWLKLATTLITIAGVATAFVLAKKSVDGMMADSEDEATQFLKKIETEPPIDMSRFAGLPSEGPANAPITIVVASDFQCSFCRALAARLDEVRAEHPRELRIMFLNAPISSKCNPHITHNTHEHACWLARAGVCAARQGRFWQYHDLVYRDLPPPRVKESGVRNALARMGVDGARLDSCLATADADSVIARDVRLWHELGMESVPSLVINGHVKTGGIYPTTLRSVVRTLLAHPS